MPFVDTRLFDALPEEQAGIVDEDVEPAPPRDRGADRTVPVFFAGNIEVVKDRCRVAPADLAGGFPSALVENVADDNPRSRLDHQPRGFCADAARRARDQGDLAVEPVHHCPPLTFGRQFSAGSLRISQRARACFPKGLFERRIQEFQTEIDFGFGGRQWRGNAHHPFRRAGAHDVGAQPELQRVVCNRIRERACRVFFTPVNRSRILSRRASPARARRRCTHIFAATRADPA